MKKSLLLICTFLFIVHLNAQQATKKTVSILHISSSLVIDGILDEKEWSSAPTAGGFFQYHPLNGGNPSLPTEVKLLYDNTAIYIAAVMYDHSSDSILTEIGKRDSDDRINYDFFSVEFDPYNDSKFAFEFLISASGVQSDNQNTLTGWDSNWNAVWESAVTINDKGWIAELKIPFSELRFPVNSDKNWGINFFRKIKRYEEFVCWNYVDNNIQGRINQAGELTNINIDKQPVRLAFYPYLTSYYENNGILDNDSYSIKGGLDLKYGITESLTLDMMLVPDFGQVKSDDQILNLGSFETYYEEKRQFFTEGATLYNRAGIFYSRRIGSQPEKFYSVNSELIPGENIKDNPGSKKLLNATKFSGRFDDGWSLAVLNAYSLETYAEVENTVENTKREILTSPASNSNVFVIEKSLSNNSFLSLINTNVYKPSVDYSANVTGSEFSFANESQKTRFSGKLALSQIYQDKQSPDFGWYYDLNFTQSVGDFQFSFQNRIYNEKYNPNDLGFLLHNNEIFNQVLIEYKIFRPVWVFRTINTLLRYQHYSLYKPAKFSNSEIYFHTDFELKNYSKLFFDLSITPTEKYDFYEPRVWGKQYNEPRAVYVGTGYHTDAKKILSAGTEVGYWIAEEHNKSAYWLTWLNKIRFSNNLSLNLELNFNKLTNAIGFADKSLDNSVIYFGRRDADIFTNVLEMKYTISTSLSVDLRIRHYIYSLLYKEFYLLGDDGYMKKTKKQLSDRNLTYNNFNAELSLIWNFAPGSELVLLWKNRMDQNKQNYNTNYFDRLNDIFSEPKINNLSLRMIYYIPYSQIF